jgi:SIR2-like domain
MVELSPYLSLAFALHSSPGTYALLLGAGVSLPSGVPGAWQVLHWLIGDLAAASGEDRPADPEAWWVETYGVPPTYDGVLEKLTHSPEERRTLLAQFFEPTPEEREDGRKQPSAAHQAIARLVQHGAVRLILTTNFDLLTETALRQAGIEPVVVSTPGAIATMAPLHAQQCVVIHLHGDYKSPGVLNTQDELGTYDPAVDAKLDQVFGEYGLVVIGWSAEWDLALRSALERAPARRFATYWVEPGQPKEHARRLIASRGAAVAPATADDFLGKLADSVESLTAVTGRRHPLDVRTAVATAKRQLAGAQVAIDLHDRLRTEIGRVAASEPVKTSNFNGSPDEYSRRLRQLETDTEMLLALVATAAYWGTPRTDDWWFDSVERFAHRRHVGGTTTLIYLTQAPAVMTAYAAGISAVAHRRYDLAVRLFVEPTCEDHTGSRRDQMLRILGPDLFGVPHPSHYLYELLRHTLADLLALGEDRYLTAWERWEYLHQLYRYNGRLVWLPHLRVEGIGPNEGRPTTAVGLSLELERLGEDHPLVAGGLFDLATLQDRIAAFDARFRELAKDWDFMLITPAGGGWLPSARHYPGSYDEA